MLKLSIDFCKIYKFKEPLLSYVFDHELNELNAQLFQELVKIDRRNPRFVPLEFRSAVDSWHNSKMWVRYC
jgi:hypothetical protein